MEERLFGSYARGAAHDDSGHRLPGHVATADDRAITDLTGDLTWQPGGVVISPLVMSAAQFEAWKGRERRAALESDREGIPLHPDPLNDARQGSGGI